MLIPLLKIICTVYHMIVQIVKSRGWLEKVLIIPKFVFQFKLNYSFRLIQMYKRHLPVRFIGMDYFSGTRGSYFRSRKLFEIVHNHVRKRFWAKSSQSVNLKMVQNCNLASDHKFQRGYWNCSNCSNGNFWSRFEVSLDAFLACDNELFQRLF